jgi:hypothetical protein
MPISVFEAKTAIRLECPGSFRAESLPAAKHKAFGSIPARIAFCAQSQDTSNVD